MFVIVFPAKSNCFSDSLQETLRMQLRKMRRSYDRKQSYNILPIIPDCAPVRLYLEVYVPFALLGREGG